MQLISRFSKTSIFIWLAISSTLILVISSHLWALDNLPRGLYVDEASIGLNAASIATTLKDEHGHYLPIYFEAFGEYKNPLYIYTTSILFKVFGVSDFILRFTSFVFYLIFLSGFIAVVKQIFPQNRFMLLFSLITSGFVPWLFALSRISFEVISQPAILIWIIYFAIRTYSNVTFENKFNLSAIITGLLIGLSVYTYSTSRLLVFTLLASILIAYHHKNYWMRHLCMIAGCCVALIPYLVFSLNQSGALTHRFSAITYVFDPQLSLLNKATVFFTNYFSYFDLNFLLFSGDPNLRHHTGFGGEIYISIFILFIVGVWTVHKIASKNLSDSKLAYFLLLNLFIAPVAASLTEPLHSLRGLQLCIFILILSSFGFYRLLQIKHKQLRQITTITLALILIIESLFYLHNYFTLYPIKTIHAFESYGFKENLKRAEEDKPQEIVVSRYANQPYAHLEYYRYQFNFETPTYVSEPTPSPNRCIIYFATAEPVQSEFHEYQLGNPENYSKLRCYDIQLTRE